MNIRQIQTTGGRVGRVWNFTRVGHRDSCDIGRAKLLNKSWVSRSARPHSIVPVTHPSQVAHSVGPSSSGLTGLLVNVPGSFETSACGCDLYVACFRKQLASYSAGGMWSSQLSLLQPHVDAWWRTRTAFMVSAIWLAHQRSCRKGVSGGAPALGGGQRPARWCTGFGVSGVVAGLVGVGHDPEGEAANRGFGRRQLLPPRSEPRPLPAPGTS